MILRWIFAGINFCYCNANNYYVSEFGKTSLVFWVPHYDTLISAVDFICDNPEIRAISFVGSDRVGKHIYDRGSANGKRVQSNMVWLRFASNIIYYTSCHIIISKTSRFYIGLAVGLPVFSNISLILTYVQTVLSLQGKATSRTGWTDSLFLFSLFISHFIIHERFNEWILSF